MNKLLFFGGFTVFILSIYAINDPILTESGRKVFDLSKSIIGICLMYLSFKIDTFSLGRKS